MHVCVSWSAHVCACLCVSAVCVDASILPPAHTKKPNAKTIPVILFVQNWLHSVAYTGQNWANLYTHIKSLLQRSIHPISHYFKEANINANNNTDNVLYVTNYSEETVTLKYDCTKLIKKMKLTTIVITIIIWMMIIIMMMMMITIMITKLRRALDFTVCSALPQTENEK